ncbi:MAG: TRM11 family SAM-dependent methyltransferase [Candidatus Asgardarchaeia archaeon]
MREVPFEEYKQFIREHDHVLIEKVKLEIGKDWKISSYHPEKFELEKTTVWSFPERGKWATHYLNAKFRGNWAPQVARNLILKYSNPGETVLDAFLGSGTTLIECKLLGRNGIGVDINYETLMLAWDRLNFKYVPSEEITLLSWIDDKAKAQTYTWQEPNTKLYHGDARNLDKIDNNSIDLIATHPPYANIISYSQKKKIGELGNLSQVSSINEFVNEMKKVAKEFYRVLRPGRYCAILIGDTRRHKHYVPIAFRVMKAFLEVGFILKEDIIKIQHNMIGTIPWKRKERDFHLIAHEHLFVFRKPSEDENLKKFTESMNWDN